jgi:hypothetical protein
LTNAVLQTIAMVTPLATTMQDRTNARATAATAEMGRTVRTSTSVRPTRTTALGMPLAQTATAGSCVRVMQDTLAMEPVAQISTSARPTLTTATRTPPARTSEGHSPVHAVQGTRETEPNAMLCVVLLHVLLQTVFVLILRQELPVDATMVIYTITIHAPSCRLLPSPYS